MVNRTLVQYRMFEIGGTYVYYQGTFGRGAKDRELPLAPGVTANLTGHGLCTVAWPAATGQPERPAALIALTMAGQPPGFASR